MMLAAIAACALLCQEGAGDKRHFTLRPDNRVELDFQHYYKARELKTALSNLAAAYPEFLQLESPGKSRGNEELWVVRLSENTGLDPASKPAIFIYASEGLSDVQGTELALSALVEFLQEHARQERYSRALRETTLYFLPCGNPDLRSAVLAGLESGSGPGLPATPRVDLERNYPVGWSPFQVADDSGAKNPGPYPLSEPEARLISTFLVEHENIGVAVGFAPTNWVKRAGDSEPGSVREPASLLRILELQASSGGAALEFSGRISDPRGCFDDFAYGQLGALPVRLLCGQYDEQSELALPRTDEIAPLARKVAASLLALSEALPRLSIAGTSVQRLKNDLWQIEVTIANSGTLRTQSELGSVRKAIALPRLSVHGGKLAGAGLRIGKDETYQSVPVDNEQFALTELDGGAQLRVRILIAAPQETTLELTASSARAGKASASLVLR